MLKKTKLSNNIFLFSFMLYDFICEEKLTRTVGKQNM